MATRSTIAVKMSDDSIKKVYCHWDGYPSYNGKILKNHYNTQELAEKVVSLGSLSFLDKSMDCPEGHSFDNRVDGHSVAYGRDRGEEIEFEIFADKKSYDVCKNWEEYNYYWDGEKWFVDGKELTDEIIEND